MTPEQEKEVVKIGQKLREIFPKMYGSVRFNLRPDRKDVNMNIVVEYSTILKSNK